MVIVCIFYVLGNFVYKEQRLVNNIIQENRFSNIRLETNSGILK